MSISNILKDGKIVPGVLPNPYPFPATPQGLGQVLQVNNSAATPFGNLPQDATDFQTLGCIQISTGLVFAGGNNTELNVGDGNVPIVIQGAIEKGSLLVGNGVKTDSLPVPSGPALPNGSVLILDDTTPTGVRWGGESGDINSITPGNNIDITGPTANPIVALQNPLTSTLNIGSVSITGANGVNTSLTINTTGDDYLWNDSNTVAQSKVSIAPSSVGFNQSFTDTNQNNSATCVETYDNTGISNVSTYTNQSQTIVGTLSNVVNTAAAIVDVGFVNPTSTETCNTTLQSNDVAASVQVRAVGLAPPPSPFQPPESSIIMSSAMANM